MGVMASGIISGLTAVFTVTLTIWLYQRRDKLNALRAVKAEAKQNKHTAETIHEHITEDIQLREDGRERMTSIQPLSNSSYQNIKNSGILTQLPEDTRKTISKHYSRISFANHQLEYRQQMRSTSRALSNLSAMLEIIDQVILKEMILMGAVDLTVTSEAVDNPDFEEAFDKITTFDDVIKSVDNELNNHPILTKIICTCLAPVDFATVS